MTCWGPLHSPFRAHVLHELTWMKKYKTCPILQIHQHFFISNNYELAFWACIYDFIWLTKSTKGKQMHEWNAGSTCILIFGPNFQSCPLTALRLHFHFYAPLLTLYKKRQSLFYIGHAHYKNFRSEFSTILLQFASILSIPWCFLQNSCGFSFSEGRKLS